MAQCNDPLSRAVRDRDRSLILVTIININRPSLTVYPHTFPLYCPICWTKLPILSEYTISQLWQMLHAKGSKSGKTFARGISGIQGTWDNRLGDSYCWNIDLLAHFAQASFATKKRYGNAMYRDAEGV